MLEQLRRAGSTPLRDCRRVTFAPMTGRGRSRSRATRRFALHIHKLLDKLFYLPERRAVIRWRRVRADVRRAGPRDDRSRSSRPTRSWRSGPCGSTRTASSTGSRRSSIPGAPYRRRSCKTNRHHGRSRPRGAPVWAVAPELEEFLGDSPVVGQNVLGFDILFLRRAGVATVKTVRHTAPGGDATSWVAQNTGWPRYAIGSTYGRGATPGVADAEAALQVFLRLRERALELPAQTWCRPSNGWRRRRARFAGSSASSGRSGSRVRE